MANRKSKTLPKTIYVKKESDQNDPDSAYLLADEGMLNMDDGDTVGVYELKETRVLRVTRELK